MMMSMAGVKSGRLIICRGVDGAEVELECLVCLDVVVECGAFAHVYYVSQLSACLPEFPCVVAEAFGEVSQCRCLWLAYHEHLLVEDGGVYVELEGEGDGLA